MTGDLRDRVAGLLVDPDQVGLGRAVRGLDAVVAGLALVGAVGVAVGAPRQALVDVAEWKPPWSPITMTTRVWDLPAHIRTPDAQPDIVRPWAARLQSSIPADRIGTRRALTHCVQSPYVRDSSTRDRQRRAGIGLQALPCAVISSLTCSTGMADDGNLANEPPGWWPYPVQCGHRHPWSPSHVIVSYLRCPCRAD